ncbi:hypothetical protein [Desulfocurvus sp. DL9XJH121]
MPDTDARLRPAPLSALVRYVRASPLPNALAATCIGAAAALLGAALARSAHWPLPVHMLAHGLGVGCLGLACVALLDGFSRFREYRRIRGILARRGWDRRVFLLVAGSRCQRDAALLAAREAGHGGRAVRLFRGLGYRWYHVLPDAVLRNPLLFVRPGYLRSSFLPGKVRSARD